MVSGLGRPRLDPEVRFWSKVSPSANGCWNWVACKVWDGYGRFRLPDRTVRAHRYSYEMLIGDIPDDMQVDHLCRNRSCVNPTHMELVTHYENQRRGLGTITSNVNKTVCSRGHPYDNTNTYVYGTERQCRICKRDQMRKRRETIRLNLSTGLYRVEVQPYYSEGISNTAMGGGKE